MYEFRIFIISNLYSVVYIYLARNAVTRIDLYSLFLKKISMRILDSWSLLPGTSWKVPDFSTIETTL